MTVADTEQYDEVLQRRARKTLKALAALHPTELERRELEEAGVASSRINALYPLSAEFFLECMEAYLTSGDDFFLLVDESDDACERLEVAAWSTFRTSESDRLKEMLNWWMQKDEDFAERLRDLMRQADPDHKLGEKDYYDVCANTLWLLARLFWYQTNLHSSSNPRLVHDALVRVFVTAMPDLVDGGAL